MMASFCFALFSFQLDKVDETIIFVIGQCSRNVIVEDFCRWRALAMDQNQWRNVLRNCFSASLPPPPFDYELVKMDCISQQALQVLYHCGKK